MIIYKRFQALPVNFGRSQSLSLEPNLRRFSILWVDKTLGESGKKKQK